MLNYLTLLSV